ncbi:Gfo/Idh/MocA family protein [Prosthecomicrobium sp. N25]|uniref:Gfo/Idh/MocA family protein n=1 Tax=Prosthecomicrobium sp. N25 TaxID=3129254 RepID=UPI00307892DA
MSAIKTVAVVGCGIGRSHIFEGYANHPDRFRVLAICDLDDERLKKVGDEFAVPIRTKSFDELLAMPDLDIVDICTPPGLHVPQTLAALAAGKEVVCEKPIAGSLADVDRLIEAEKAARGRVMPIFQYRWGNGYQKARQVVGAGLAGRPYAATVETHWKRTAEYYAVPWRGKFATELGGVLVTHAIHIHDMLVGLMGPIRSVFARVATLVNDIEVEDTVAASLEMESGALVTLSCNLGSAVEISRMRAIYENVTFESGTACYSPGDEPWTITPVSTAAPAIEAELGRFQPVHRRFQGQVEAYHDALLSGGELPVTLADARRSLELVTAIYHSAETGRPVELPIGTDHPKYHGWAPKR